jgi:NAD(P)-dependent dehydrogenase (short-subunit alcohol dehydrogenase family)
MKSENSRRCVVTGGATGIGYAVAEQLIAEGHEVCIVGRRAQALDSAIASLGRRCWAVPCDLGDEKAIVGLVAAVVDRWSGLDGLVNNAGVAPMATAEETTTETWDHTFAVNVRGPFVLVRELLPLLRAGVEPSVVNVSSTLAEKAIPGMAAYNASKAALNQLTRSLALELAPTIRVNAVLPAVVDTPIHAGRGMTSEQVHELAGLHPLARVGLPDDIASLIGFLLSSASSWMTGAVIPVDGGMLAT